MLDPMLIRAATLDDWPRIWPFMRQIATAGETFSWDRDITEDDARDGWFRWLKDRRGCTVVAVAADGVIMGTAETGPNHGGPAAHVASASFMVDPATPGAGWAGHLASTFWNGPRRRVSARWSSTPSWRPTSLR